MIILASASPRRRDLLDRLGLDFEVRPSGVPEDDIGGSPSKIARLLAERKARAQRVGSRDLVVAADTVLDVRGNLVGKPRDPAAALEMLGLLRGTRHSVVTALAVADSARCLISAVETEVYMRDYSDEEIADYVESGEPLDKAGAYAIQGLGGAFVSEIRGCYYNVVGLPLCELRFLLSEFGVQLPAEICSRTGPSRCPREV